MRKLILILSLIFTVMLSSPSNSEVLICKFIGWNCSVNFKDLVRRDGLFFKKRTDNPYTGKSTGDEQGSLKDGKREGLWGSYYDEGQLSSKGNYKNGYSDGPWFYYHSNGQLSSKGNYKNGYSDGPWFHYYSNGQLQIKGNYKDGKKEGPWVYYGFDGTVDEKRTGTYKNGVKVK